MYWNHSATTCSVKPALLTVLRWSGQTACNTDVNLGNVEIKKKKKVPQCGKGRSGLICGATEFPLIPMDWRAALPAGWQTDEKKWSQYDSKNRGTKPRLKISRNIQWLTGEDDRFFYCEMILLYRSYRGNCPFKKIWLRQHVVGDAVNQWAGLLHNNIEYIGLWSQYIWWHRNSRNSVETVFWLMHCITIYTDMTVWHYICHDGGFFFFYTSPTPDD